MTTADPAPLPRRLRLGRLLLWTLPVMWVALLANDVTMSALAAAIGEPVLYLNRVLLGAPLNLRASLVHPEWTMLWIPLLAAAATAVDLGISLRLRTSRGPALAALGVSTMPYLLVLAVTAWANPLTVSVFSAGGDAGYIEIAPGPLWFQPHRGLLIAAIAAIRIAAILIIDLPGPPAEEAATQPRKRPRPAILAGIGLATLIGIALTILVVNGLAVADQFAHATAMAPESHSLREFQADGVVRFTVIALPLIAAIAISLIIAMRLRRGGRRGLVAIGAGLLAAAWPVILYVCLLLNPGGWRSPMRLRGDRMEVAWYPTVVGPLMIIAVVAVLLYWVGLLWPGTVRWLATGSASRPHLHQQRPH